MARLLDPHLQRPSPCEALCVDSGAGLLSTSVAVRGAVPQPAGPPCAPAALCPLGTGAAACGPHMSVCSLTCFVCKGLRGQFHPFRESDWPLSVTSRAPGTWPSGGCRPEQPSRGHWPSTDGRRGLVALEVNKFSPSDQHLQPGHTPAASLWGPQGAWTPCLPWECPAWARAAAPLVPQVEQWGVRVQG